jgi:hypothetical protein
VPGPSVAVTASSANLRRCSEGHLVLTPTPRASGSTPPGRHPAAATVGHACAALGTTGSVMSAW